MAVVLGGRGSNVVGRVEIEEIDRLEHEPDVRHGHHRPVFAAGDVVVVEGVPHHQVSIFNRFVGLGPLGQPLTACVLIGIIARREVFIWIEGRHPKVLRHIAAPLHDARFGVSKG